MPSIRWDQDGWPKEFQHPLVALEFGSEHPLSGRPVVPVINELVDMVDDIVNSFAALFQSRD